MGGYRFLRSSPQTVNNPFRKKRTRHDAALQNIETEVKKLDNRFRRLEESMERLNGKFPQVTIENVHIHQPVLEKLEFRMDGLDIEHLSGSLNLGNNFGAKFSEARNPSKPSSDPRSKGVFAAEQGDSAQPGLHKTPSGFRVNNRR